MIGGFEFGYEGFGMDYVEGVMGFVYFYFYGFVNLYEMVDGSYFLVEYCVNVFVYCVYVEVFGIVDV